MALVPPFEAAPGDERIVELASDARVRLLAPTGGVLRGLTLVADLRGAYRLSTSTDGLTFRDAGEIHAAALPGLGRHLFFFDEALSVIELAAIAETGPHAVAEVTPIVWEGVDLAVGTPQSRRYLLEGWSQDAADRRSAYAWLLGKAGLKLPDRPRTDHTPGILAGRARRTGSETGVHRDCCRSAAFRGRSSHRRADSASDDSGSG